MNRCIAYLPDGRICGEPAKYVDTRRGGMVCGDHEDSSTEIAQEIVRLNGIFHQRGADGLIPLVADELVKLRRMAAAKNVEERMLP